MQFVKILLLTCALFTFPEDAFALSTLPVSDTTLLDLARQSEAQGDQSKAIDYYEQALRSLEATAYAKNVYIRNKLAQAYISIFQFEAASVYVDSAQAILSARLYENDSLTALTWYTLGMLYDYQGRADSALFYHQKALNRRRAIYPEDHVEIAYSLLGIGDVYRFTYFDSYNAEVRYDSALQILERQPKAAYLLGDNYYKLAATYRIKGDFENALHYAHEALDLYNKAEQKNYYFISSAYSLIGSIHYQVDDFDTALYYNQLAIELARKHRTVLLLQDLPTHFNNQAEYHYQIRQYDSTIAYCQQAIDHQPSATLLSQSYQLLGNAYRMKDQMNIAFPYYRKSLGIRQKLFASRHPLLASLYLDLGRAYETANHLDSALWYYHQSLINAMISQSDTSVGQMVAVREGDDINAALLALEHKANLWLNYYKQSAQEQHLHQALEQYLLLDKTMELSRTRFDMEGSRLLHSRFFKPMYEQAIECSYQLYQRTQDDAMLSHMLHFIDKNKALVLYEAIKNTEILQSVLPDSLFLENKTLQAQLTLYRSELTRIQQQQGDSSTIADLHQKIVEIDQKLNQLKRSIRSDFPNYYQVKYDQYGVNRDSIQAVLLPNEAVISYFWGDSAIYALLLSRDQALVHKTTDIPQVQEAIHSYLEVLSEDLNQGPTLAHFQQFQQSASLLYQWLLNPLLSGLTVDHLTIIPDSELATIPFESVVTGTIDSDMIRYNKLPYLIHHYSIAYNFSLNMAYRNQLQPHSENKQDNVMAFGIQHFNTPENDAEDFSTLEGAVEEVQYIQQIFPEATLFLDDKATESNFKTHAKDADILHLATHGKANVENPFFSNFTFSQGHDQENDGTLYQYEIYSTPLKAQLLVLSACESGIGKDYPGEGNYSLARSFVYAGCQSVLMSLWSINDFVTSELVQDFYHHLYQTRHITSSIRMTKVDYLAEADETTAHPQRWAALIAMGNETIQLPNDKNDIGYILIIGMITAMLVAAMVVLRRKRLFLVLRL